MLPLPSTERPHDFANKTLSGGAKRSTMLPLPSTERPRDFANKTLSGEAMLPEDLPGAS